MKQNLILTQWISTPKDKYSLYEFLFCKLLQETLSSSDSLFVTQLRYRTTWSRETIQWQIDCYVYNYTVDRPIACFEVKATDERSSLQRGRQQLEKIRTDLKNTLEFDVTRLEEYLVSISIHKRYGMMTPSNVLNSQRTRYVPKIFKSLKGGRWGNSLLQKDLIKRWRKNCWDDTFDRLLNR